MAATRNKAKVTNAQAVRGAIDSINESMVKMAIHEDTTDDAVIDTSIPRIDFGFSGTINNALIRSSGGGGPSLFSFNPADSIPGLKRKFERNGSVTILEYSPRVLSGTFQAVLVDLTLTQEQKRQSLPRLRTVRPISGTFSYSAPWLQDPRFVKSEPGQLPQDLETGLINQLPEGTQVSEGGRSQEALSTGQNTYGSNAASTNHPPSDGASGCDCSCEGFARMTDMMDAAGSSAAPAAQGHESSAR